MQRIRAYFIDSDAAPIESLLTGLPLQPHIVVESSPGLGHAYWLVDGAELGTFRAVQLALAARYGTDTAPQDLPRVMRLPGFEHRKGRPYRTRIIELHGDRPRYSHAEFVEAFGIDVHAGASLPLKTIKRNQPPGMLASNVKPMRRTLQDVIPEGERNSTLLSLAAGLVRKGFDLQAVTNRLQRINAERCQPPLCATEVDAIAVRAIGYGSQGYRYLSDALFDALARSRLPLPVRWIVLTALRRFDGHNNGNIALTWDDCKDIPGCKDEPSFLAYRARAVTSGFLIVTQEPKPTRNGRTPTLYAIPLHYLRSHTGQNTQLAHTGQNTQSYIDKQLLGKTSLEEADGRKPKLKRDKAA